MFLTLGNARETAPENHPSTAENPKTVDATRHRAAADA
jgi:hypothetical protein